MKQHSQNFFFFFNDIKLLFSVHSKTSIGIMEAEVWITILSCRTTPWRFDLPRGNVAVLLPGPTCRLVGTGIWELNGIIISCAELSNPAVSAVIQTADQNKSLLSSEKYVSQTSLAYGEASKL